MKKQNKKYLLALARRAIEAAFRGKEIAGEWPEELKIKRAAFVTLSRGGELRGCIGHIEPVQELWAEVIEDAREAAFGDYRFEPLRAAELTEVSIEISILGAVKKYAYEKPEELVKFLEKNKVGVVLSKGEFRATFLPQVWEEIKGAEEFLGCLCQKAGLAADEWQRGVEIGVYEVEKIREE